MKRKKQAEEGGRIRKGIPKRAGEEKADARLTRIWGRGVSCRKGRGEVGRGGKNG